MIVIKTRGGPYAVAQQCLHFWLYFCSSVFLWSLHVEAVGLPRASRMCRVCSGGAPSPVSAGVVSKILSQRDLGHL